MFIFALIALLIVSPVSGMVIYYLKREKIYDALEGICYVHKGDPLTWGLCYTPFYAGIALGCVGAATLSAIDMMVAGGILLYSFFFFLMFTQNPGPYTLGIRIWLGDPQFFRNCRMTNIPFLDMQNYRIPGYSDIQITLNKGDARGTFESQMMDGVNPAVSVAFDATIILAIDIFYPLRTVRMFLDDVKKHRPKKGMDDWRIRMERLLLKLILDTGDIALQKSEWISAINDVENLNDILEKKLASALAKHAVLVRRVSLGEAYGFVIDQQKERYEARQRSDTAASVAQSEADAVIATAVENRRAAETKAEEDKKAETARLAAKKAIAEEEEKTRQAELAVAKILAAIELAPTLAAIGVIDDNEVQYALQQFFLLSPEEREKVIRNVGRALRQIPPTTVVGLNSELGAANPLAALINALASALKNP